MRRVGGRDKSCVAARSQGDVVVDVDVDVEVSV